VKSDVYAQAGIAEYWVVNLIDRLIEVHTDIAGGAYTRVTPARPDESIKMRELPGVEIAVAEILR